MSPENLFRALHAIGARYRVDGDTIRFPRGSVPDEYVTLIRHHKASLLAGACELCRQELATHGGRCAWCDAIRGREVVYEPGSDAERVFLAVLERGDLTHRRAA